MMLANYLAWLLAVWYSAGEQAVTQAAKLRSLCTHRSCSSFSYGMKEAYSASRSEAKAVFPPNTLS